MAQAPAAESVANATAPRTTPRRRRCCGSAEMEGGAAPAADEMTRGTVCRVRQAACAVAMAHVTTNTVSSLFVTICPTP